MGYSNDKLNKSAEFFDTLPLATLVKKIMVSCVEAQTSAVEASKRYFEQFVFDAQRQDSSVAEISFSYMANGEVCQLVLPVITILPLPSLMIDKVNVNFEAEASVSDEKNLSVNMLGLNYDVDINQNMSLNSNLSLSIDAYGSEIPSGMAQLLELLGNEGVVLEDAEILPENNSVDVQNVVEVEDLDPAVDVSDEKINGVGTSQKLSSISSFSVQSHSPAVITSSIPYNNYYLNRILNSIEVNGLTNRKVATPGTPRVVTTSSVSSSSKGQLE